MIYPTKDCKYDLSVWCANFHEVEGRLNEKDAEMTDVEKSLAAIDGILANKSDGIICDFEGEGMISAPGTADNLVRNLRLYGNTEQDGTSGKNLLKNTATTQTSNGVTFTVNEDGTIVANGTATAGTVLTLQSNLVLEQECILSDITNGNRNTDFIYATNQDTNVAYYAASNQTPTLPAGTYLVQIKVNADATLSNRVFSPMIRLASITDGTYEPYSGGQPSPNPELPCEIKSVVVNEVKVHGKNLLPNEFIAKEGNGVTASINPDKSITFNGTATKMTDFYIFGSNSDKGKYIKLPKGSKLFGDYKGIGVFIREKTIGVLMGFDKVAKTLMEQDVYAYGIFLRAAVGDNYNNTTYYPMVYESSLGDVSYEPYTENSINLSQPIELNGNGNLRDDLTPDEVVRKFSKAVFDGSADESWVASTEGAGRYYIDAITCKQHGEVKCTQAIGVTGSSSVVNTCLVSFNVNTKKGRFIINTSFATLAEWKAHLAENPITVVYELLTPITEPLPTADQIALRSLLSYDGVTYLEVDCDEVVPTMKASMVMDTKSYIDAKFNELKVALGV